ncbi:MAG: pseudouridine synthase [Rhodanobacter sp.]
MTVSTFLLRRDYGASAVHLPAGTWATVLDALCARFPRVSREQWLDRMLRGRVLDAQGLAITAQTAYQAGLRVRYFREVTDEQPIPVTEAVLHVDDHLLVADKPHFLPVMPAGKYLEETLLHRLMERVDNPNLVPLHRIDRATAGLVLFSTNPASRAAYQALFREHKIHKRYVALAPPLLEQPFPCVRRSRLVTGEPFFRTCEAVGEPNSETRIEVIERGVTHWRYALTPVTGKKHQLRVHMAALGAPICNDRWYPQLADDAPDDFQRPLQLLAQRLTFVDPVSGEMRCFESQLALA